MKSWVIRGRSAIVSIAAAILVCATPTAVEAQATHTVCPPGNPSAPCDYDSPGAALSDAGVVSGDTLEIANDAYTLTGTLVVDRGLTLNFNDSIVDANGVRAVSVDGASLIDANVTNLPVNGSANWAPLENIAYGQTFTSTATELLTAFQFQIETSNFPDTITIPGVVRSGGIGGPVIATASATFGPAGFETVTTTFHLDQPVELIQGNVYAVEYIPTANTRISQALNPYAGGTGYSTGDVGLDYAFAALGGPAVSINDVTIRNGQAPAGPGGALLVSNGAVVTLSGATVENNTAPDGAGGLANVNAYLTVSNSDLSGNSTVDAGGALLTQGAAAATIVSQSTIDGNFAGLGGGVAALAGGRVDLVDSTVSNNAALSSGVDLDFLANNGTSISCSPVQSFTANDIALSGFRFAIRLNGGNPVPDDLPVSGVLRDGGEFGPVIGTATALLPGGLAGIQALTFNMDTAPVALVPGATYTVEFTLNAGYSPLQSAVNYAGGDSVCAQDSSFPRPDWAFQTIGGTPGNGGGIYSEGGVNLVNVTVSGNVGDGGFAGAGSHSISAVLSTISNNSGNGLTAEAGGAGQGGVIAFGGSILALNGGNDCDLGDTAAVVVSQDYNLIGDLSGCGGGLLALQPNDQAGGDGAAVIDPLLGPLQENGGPTRTQALDPASPAVDSGASDPTCGLGTAPFADQRGIARPQLTACDAGAFELEPPLQSLIDAAAPGGTVIVPDGIYNESIVLANSGITLQGSGPDNVVINATGLGTPGVTATESFTMIGMRVTGANVSGQGAGIRIIGSALDVVLDNVRIDNNVSASLGGGIFADINSRLTATNVQIDNNSALDGGGIYTGAFADSIVFDNVQILSNTATRNGGGIYAESADSFSIGTAGCAGTPIPGSQSNIIANNTAPAGQGGGIYDARSDFVITDTRFTGNEAVDGGAMFHSAFNTTQATNIGCSVLGTNLATGGSGGAINLAAGALTISQSVFESNAAAAQGGAINDLDGTLTVSSTEFLSNSAPNGGGAINTLGLGDTVAQSTFRNNFSAFGGGGAVRGTLASENNLYDTNSTNARGGAYLVPEEATSFFVFQLSSVGDTFTNNTARDGGGAIAVDESQPSVPAFGILNVTDGLFDGNQVGEGSLSVSGRGGAIEFSGTQATVENTQFINNSAPESGDGQSQGGAIFAAATDAFTISNSTISESSAGDGGAIYNEGVLSVVGSALIDNSVADFNVEPRGGAIASTGTLNVSNSTISGNVVNPGPANTGDGGAIASFAGGTTNLNNVTLWGNTAPDGGALYAEPNQGPLTFSNTLFFDNSATTADCDRVQSLGYNIYDVNPCPTQAATDIIGDPLVGLLTNNGGPTDTHALLPGSPAQDAGAPVPLLFPDFTNLAAFSVQGDAVLDGSTLLLAGAQNIPTVSSVYVTDPVDVSSNFSARFGFRITPGSGGQASDGITFTIGDDPTFLGDNGGALGIGSFDDDGVPPYVPTGPTVSGVSVEFDTWDNGVAEGANDTGLEHVGINLDGSLSSAALTDIGPAGTLSDSSVWTAWIDYNAATDLLEVRVSNTGSRPASATVSLTVDILAETDANADGNVYAGFTGAAGSLTGIGAEQRILNFQFVNEVSCEPVDQRGVQRPEGLRCDIGAFEGSAIPGTIDNAVLGVNTNVTQPGVVEVPLIDIPIERLTGVVGDTTNPPESAPLSSFPLSSFPLSSLNLRASPLSSFPLSSFPLSSFEVEGAPLSSFPLSSFPLLSETGGWAAVIAQIPSLAGAPLQNVTLEQVFDASDRPADLLDNITLGSLSIQGSPLSSLYLAGLSLGDGITVGILDEWLANASTGTTVCGELAVADFTDCATSDTLVSLQVKGAPLSSLPLSSLPLSSFPLSSLGITEAPLSSFPLSSLPLSSFPLSSFPLSSFPLSSLPLSSLPLSSFPLSSFDVFFSPLSSLPLSSFPLSSLPLSSFSVGGQAFCAYYDALASVDGQPTCSALGIDPASDGLPELLAALQSTGATTLASTPLSSFPLSSFDISSVPLSSFQLDFASVVGAPLSSFPLSSLPLSSLPLSSLDASGQTFCEVYDAAAIPEGQATCGVLGIGNGSDFGELIAALLLNGQSTFASTPLSSLPLSSLPLSSLPLSSFPLSSLEINGAPLSSFPLSSFDILGSPLSSLPLSSFPLSSFLLGGTACEGCTTLGDAFVGGQVISDAPLSSLFGSEEFEAVALGDLLDAFTLEYLFSAGGIDPNASPDTLGEIADPGNLTLGQLLVSLILRSDFPWENIALADLDPQTFAADNTVGYFLDFQLNGTLVDLVTIDVTLSDQFYLRPGSVRFITQSQSGSTPVVTPIADPVMTPNPDGTVTMSFGPVAPGAFSDNTLEFQAVPPLALGNFPTAASLSLGAAPAATADASSATVEVVASSNNESDSIDFPASTATNTLILGHIDTREDIDYFRISAPPRGSRVAVFMTNPVEDNDLLLYEPLSTVEAKGQIIEAASLDSVPFEDDGVDFSGNRQEEPDALEDTNIAGLPLSSLSTNRGDADEEVSAISSGEDFTLQVSGYNGSVSDQPYTLRVKVTPEVPVTACSPRTWTGAAPAGDWVPAGSWQPDTSAVFLVNWQRLADSEQALGRDGAAAADSALDAVNALVTAPGVTNGVVVDVSTIPGVNYAPWDLDPCDVDAANNVVNAITAYLEQQRADSPNLAYVTIVGSDEVIPFKRKGDETDIANESTFATTFTDNALYGSLASRNFLSDDTYGDIDPVKWSSGRYLNIPELAVGRLVESAADIRSAAENYLMAGGVLTPTTALSAGYDFVADASADIQESFSAYGLNSTALIDLPGAELPWDRIRFLEEAGVTSNDARDVVSFNMHFDYDDALPSSGDALRLNDQPGYQDNLINVADLAGVDLTGRIWFTVGCHSGINAADIAMLNGEPTQDWAQTLNSLGAVYVGQAAYGLGDTVALALTERLLANFARNLNGNVTAGQAHAFAKQGYFKDLGVYGEYDYKALQASVYFGLPMYRVQNPLVVEDPLPLLRPVVRDPISNLNSLSLTIEPNVTSEITDKGTLYSVEGETQFVHYRPLQPIIGVDVTSEDRDLVARSAFITGLVTRDELVTDMAFARPVIDEGALEPEIETDEVIFPTRFTNISSYRVPAEPGPFEDRQQLNIIAGQYTSNAGQDFGTQRIFTTVDVQVFYQPTAGTATLQSAVVPASSLEGAKTDGGASKTSVAPATILDDTRPELDNINASVVESGGGFQAAFTVDASDTVGVVTRVAVLYRQSFDGQNATWVLEDLVKGSGNTWTGGAAVDGSGLINGELDYQVQALDDSGNVANSTFKGAFYVARETPPPPPPTGGNNGTFGIDLRDGNGDSVTPGQWSLVDPVVVSVTNQAPSVAYEFALDSPSFQPLAGDITVTGDGVHFVTVREVGGANSASFTVLIDTTPPALLLNSPSEGAFVISTQEAPIADFDCLDAGSGTAVCDATVPLGQPVSMAPGTQSIAVSAVDFAGNLAPTLTNTYYVVEPLTIDSPLDPVSIQDPVVIRGGATDLDGFSETVTVDWGDGVTEAISVADFVNGVSHVYAAPDIYRVTVTVDYDGAFSQQIVSDFVVVYDPAGGFVTGGGWIDSPPGAYTPNDDTDPDLTGKASFGFVAKYKRGRSTPEGNTNFKFKAGDLSFRSVDYEYLIISGARARFKGRGRVNGGSELYQFKITALDADVNNNDAHVDDSFRIQIWGDNGVLYDNGRGAEDGSGDGGTTALGGGSISIKDR